MSAPAPAATTPVRMSRSVTIPSESPSSTTAQVTPASHHPARRLLDGRVRIAHDRRGANQLAHAPPADRRRQPSASRLAREELHAAREGACEKARRAPGRSSTGRIASAGKRSTSVSSAARATNPSRRLVEQRGEAEHLALADAGRARASPATQLDRSAAHEVGGLGGRVGAVQDRRPRRMELRLGAPRRPRSSSSSSSVSNGGVPLDVTRRLLRCSPSWRLQRQARAHDDVADFGYNQQLDRSIGKFASFAAGVSYISILTGVFQLFYFGFAFGGPAYWWTWPMVFVGQLMVALCFAELAANFPVAGSIYNWGKRMGSATIAWLGGWMMLTASIVTIAAVALAYQITLPEISGLLPVLRRRHGRQRLRHQRGHPRHRPDRLHDRDQRARRQADVAHQQHRRLHRADRRGGPDRRARREHRARARHRLRDPRHGRGPRLGLLRRLPRRVARLRLRDVRLRHGQLARARRRRTPARPRRSRSCAR